MTETTKTAVLAPLSTPEGARLISHYGALYLVVVQRPHALACVTEAHPLGSAADVADLVRLLDHLRLLPALDQLRDEVGDLAAALADERAEAALQTELRDLAIAERDAHMAQRQLLERELDQLRAQIQERAEQATRPPATPDVDDAPARARKEAMTEAQRAAFLAALGDRMTVVEAAAAAGVHQTAPYKQRSIDRAFAERWDAALGVDTEGRIPCGVDGCTVRALPQGISAHRRRAHGAAGGEGGSLPSLSAP